MVTHASVAQNDAKRTLRTLPRTRANRIGDYLAVEQAGFAASSMVMTLEPEPQWEPEPRSAAKTLLNEINHATQSQPK